MRISPLLSKLVSNLSEKNYEQTLSDYRFWTKIGATHGWISDAQLENDIKANMNPGLVDPQWASLIHPTSRLLPKFITDVEPNRGSSTHNRLCRSTLEDFFADVLDRNSRPFGTRDQQRFYTNATFLAHWVNLGYPSAEDVRDHILQSLILRRPVPPPTLGSLLVLLKIAGATFAAYANPSAMDSCLTILKSTDSSDQILSKYTKVRVLACLTSRGHQCSENRRF